MPERLHSFGLPALRSLQHTDTRSPQYNTSYAEVAYGPIREQSSSLDARWTGRTGIPQDRRHEESACKQTTFMRVARPILKLVRELEETLRLLYRHHIWAMVRRGVEAFEAPADISGILVGRDVEELFTFVLTFTSPQRSAEI